MNTTAATPPPAAISSAETEQALLGAILLNNEAFGMVSDLVQSSAFVEPVHALIFDTIARQIAAGQKVTPITLRPSLPDTDIGGVSMHAYLARLCSGATTVMNAPDYGRLIKDLHVSRQLAGIGDELRGAAASGITPAESLDTAWRKIETLRQAADEVTDITAYIGVTAARLADRITEIRQGRTQPAVTTGLAEYDRALGGGYRRQRLYIEAGRPGSGKTIKALVSARRIAKAGYGVRVQSLEIDDDEVTSRIVASELSMSSSPIPYRDIVTGALDDAQHERVAEMALKMADWPLSMDCSSSISMAQIEARARIDKAKRERKGQTLDVLIIDYLSLVKTSNRYKGNRVAEIGEIAYDAKNMSKRLDCAVVLLSQLNRGVESREDKRPNMSDLRESGNIEEHADAITFCYRPAYYLAKSPEFRRGDQIAMEEMALIKNNLELIIDKNRLGDTGTRHFWCDVALNAIEDKAR